MTLERMMVGMAVMTVSYDESWKIPIMTGCPNDDVHE